MAKSPQENTVGAPTEGLGQNVTFAFKPDGSPPQMDGSRAQLLQAQAEGGNVRSGPSQGQTMQQAPDMTVDYLFKIGGEILRPHLEELRTGKFVEGMQRAMQGEAITDIAKNQPWYSSLFGGADVIEGARQYLGNTRVQETIASMEEDMPKLRQMEPPAARDYFVKAVSSNLTGDKPADAAILQGMTRALPGVMRRQAKEHYGWKQNEAAIAESSSFRAGVRALQSNAGGLADGSVTPEEFNGQVMQFARSIAPVDGRDIPNYQKARTADLVGAAEAGQFHAVNALRQLGFMDALEPGQRNTVENAVNSAETRSRAKYSFDWNDQLTDLETRAGKPPVGTTPDQLLAEVDAMNKKYQSATGSSIGLISPAQRSAIGKGSAMAIAHATEQEASRNLQAMGVAATAAEKEAAKARLNSNVLQAFSEGNLFTIEAIPGVSKKETDFIASQAWAGIKDPAQRIGLITNNFVKGTTVIGPISDQLDGGVLGVMSSGEGALSAVGHQVYQQWRAMNAASPEATAAYYKNTNTKMVKFHNLMQAYGEGGEQIAYQASFGMPAGVKQLDHKDLASAVSVINSETSSLSPTWLGGRALRPESASLVAHMISPYAATYADANGGNIKEAATVGLKRAQALGEIEVLGSHAWITGKNRQSLQGVLTRTGAGGQVAVATDTVGDVVDGSIDELLYGDGKTAGLLKGKASRIMVSRIDTPGDQPALMVMAYDSENNLVKGVINADSMFGMYDKRKQRAMENAKSAQQIFAERKAAFNNR